MRTWILLLVILTGAAPGRAAEEARLVLQRLQEGINNQAMTALLGPVDVEFVYTLNPQARTVALLEPGPEPPPPREDPPAPVVPRDSLDTAVPADATTTTTGAPAHGACCGAVGAGGVVARLDSVTGDSVWVPVEVEPQAETERSRPEIPADLADADPGALKARLTPPDVGAERTAYLAVLEVAPDSGHRGERLSLAEDELPLMERRLLRWDARQIYRNWPTGALLYLTSARQALAEGQETLPVTWELRRPGAPGAAPRVLASGALELDLRRVDGQWLVSGIQHLVGALHGTVVPTGVAIASARTAR